MTATTLEPKEIEKFSAIAAQWWDEQGDFAPLHRINPVRIGHIRQTVQSHFQREDIKGLSVIDIGCGGGLVSEPLTRLGAKVTGIDGAEKNIKTAIAHAQQTDLNIDYRTTTAEDLAAKGAQFDVVLALEVIEHVADVDLFLQSITTLAKPGGVIIISTINRTLKAYALAIIGAEYILRWLPRGTHEWKKFLKPSEIIIPLQKAGFKHIETTGMVMNPLTQEWRMDARDVEVNYYAAFSK